MSSTVITAIPVCCCRVYIFIPNLTVSFFPSASFFFFLGYAFNHPFIRSFSFILGSRVSGLILMQTNLETQKHRARVGR